MPPKITLDLSKKLDRSRTDRTLAGVCGGIAQWLGKVDATWIRLLFVLLAFAMWSGVLLYLILAIIVPEEPGESKSI